MKKEIGLWIDHRKAVIVMISDEGEEVKEITSKMEENSGSSTDSSKEGQKGNQLNNYYDAVIDVIRDADSILIFGPGEAKGEFAKRCEHEGIKERGLAVENADNMTDPQIAAKVREHFHHVN